MKFWELVSVCRTEPELLDRLAAKPDWAGYLQWYRDFDRLVQQQDRAKLDAELPADAVLQVLSGSRTNYYQSEGFVRAKQHGPDDRVLSAVDVVTLYGGSFLEDVSEAGLAPVPQG